MTEIQKPYPHNETQEEPKTYPAKTMPEMELEKLKPKMEQMEKDLNEWQQKALTIQIERDTVINLITKLFNGGK